MPDRGEVVIPTPHIVIEAAEAIKSSGEFKRGLSGNEVSGLVKGIVSELVTGNPSVRGSIPFMDVAINQGQATIKGTIRIDAPLGATVGIDMILKNARGGGNLIELGDLKVKPKADNFVGGIALKALDLEGKAKQALSNPTQAMNTYLSAEMKKQGVKLEGTGMNFTPDDKFTILLRGKTA